LELTQSGLPGMFCIHVVLLSFPGRNDPSRATVTLKINLTKKHHCDILPVAEVFRLSYNLSLIIGVSRPLNKIVKDILADIQFENQAIFAKNN
jgi:hypothetical protein